jgi:hypothetical protein
MVTRCKIVGDNFFESVPAGDAHILKHVIHDWSDEDSMRILRRVHDAGRPGGKLFLVEDMIRPGNDFAPAELVDLEMLVFTDGGRERTEEHFVRLFRESGFELVRVLPTRSPTCIVEAVRALR